MSTIPHLPNPNGNVITVENVRHFLLDRAASDNALDLDLFFSEPEILDKFKYVASEYNDLPPIGVSCICANKMPFHTFLLYGIAYHLYISKLQQLQRNDIDYSAGNLSVDVEKRRIDHILKMLPVYRETFRQGASDYKTDRNFRRGFGQVG